MSGLTGLTKRVGDLEKGRKDDMVRIMELEKEDLINKEMKMYENNIKVVGYKFLIKDAQKRDDAGQEKWRRTVLQKVLIDTKVVEADKLFHIAAGPLKGKEIRGVVRDVHPLSQKSNAAVVIAFCESWFAHLIHEKVKSGKNLQMKGVKILQHHPLIIDTLKNEALRERRKMIEAPGKTRRIHCNVTMHHPWVTLMEVTDDKKEAVPFQVEDGRLVNPAKCLAILHLNGVRKFTPYKFLGEAEKADIPKNAWTQVQLKPSGNDIEMRENS
jgi:hypothetical protein